MSCGTRGCVIYLTGKSWSHSARSMAVHEQYYLTVINSEQRVNGNTIRNMMLCR